MNQPREHRHVANEKHLSVPCFYYFPHHQSIWLIFSDPKLVYPEKVFLTRSVHGVCAPCVAAALSRDLNRCMRQQDSTASASWGTSRLMGSGTSDDVAVTISAQWGSSRYCDWVPPTLRSFCTSLRLLHAVSRFYYMRKSTACVSFSFLLDC